MSGRTSMSNIDENLKTTKKIVLNNIRGTIRKVAKGIGIAQGSFETIFNNFLNLEQKNKICPES